MLSVLGNHTNNSNSIITWMRFATENQVHYWLSITPFIMPQTMICRHIKNVLPFL